ncbi:polyketide cyc domain-containing protein [Citrus sinensis]|uniref:Polyketide cyc domain-containing protein n=1 Tax=Citrus sinensis TaxID=2711 RepID=A0ACB8MME2_CITSI|nr:polyketide cyc domain-containing protein [Citrus sinensis]
MRACPLSLDSSGSCLLFFPISKPATTATSHSTSRFPFTSTRSSIQKTPHSILSVSPEFNLSQFKRNGTSYCSNTNSSELDIEEDDDDVLSEEGSGSQTQSLHGDGVCIEIKKLGRNSRRIRSKIEIDASLDTVWHILTDYEKLADFVPNLAVSQVVEKNDNFVRLYQIGQQNLAFGIKFNAKGVLDCYEKDLEIFPSGKKRDIEFKMIEGDFQLFEGKWSIEQFNGGKFEDSESLLSQKFQTTLSYSVDVRPKLWLPVRLVEGRLCNEIKTNLSCIREAAKKLINEALHAN